MRQDPPSFGQNPKEEQLFFVKPSLTWGWSRWCSRQQCRWADPSKYWRGVTDATIVGNVFSRTEIKLERIGQCRLLGYPDAWCERSWCTYAETSWTHSLLFSEMGWCHFSYWRYQLTSCWQFGEICWLSQKGRKYCLSFISVRFVYLFFREARRTQSAVFFTFMKTLWNLILSVVGGATVLKSIFSLSSETSFTLKTFWAEPVKQWQVALVKLDPWCA